MAQCNSVCMLPSSGAWAFSANGPMRVLPASADTLAMATCPNPMPPHSLGMWGSHNPHSWAAPRMSMIARTQSSRPQSSASALASMGRTT